MIQNRGTRKRRRKKSTKNQQVNEVIQVMVNRTRSLGANVQNENEHSSFGED